MDEGDFVKIVLKDETIEGILMPSTKTTTFVKLKSGYNLGIDKKKIVSMKLVKKTIDKKEKEEAQPKKADVSILHTGGTIASKVDYKTGGVHASFTGSDLLNMFPNLGKIAKFRSILVSNMMSEDIRFSDYKKISENIQKEIKQGVKGIIVGHGTDTLALTATALSFMLENLPIPVIIVGSQRSSDSGSSDAEMNLVCATEFIIKTDFKGVEICIHEN